MLWLLALVSAEVVAFVVVWRFFVRSGHGQWLDTVALRGNGFGQVRAGELVTTILTTISAASLAVATGVVGFIALARRRLAVAVGVVVLIAGANLTTQVLKQLITRPELGIDPERASAGNSLPSGHTTVAASVAVALILVLPNRLRGPCAVLAAVLVSATGVATLSAGWHRPSDAVAALLVTGVWAGLAGLVIVGAQRRYGTVDYGRASRFGLTTLLLGGVVLLAAAGLIAMLAGDVWPVPPDQLGHRRTHLAYVGGAVGITGTACLMLVSVLATAHRVVPQVVDPTTPQGPPAS